MSSRQLTTRLINEVQRAVANFEPSHPDTDRDQLAALARAVLSSVDIRDLRGTPSERLVGQLEHMLSLLEQRRKGEIKVNLRYIEDQDLLVVESCLEDQPFLVSTMRAALASEHYEVKRFINAIAPVRRDPSGRLLSIGAGESESVMRVEVGHSGASAGPDGGGIPIRLRERIEQRLRLTQAMVQDFEKMKARIQSVADSYFAGASAAVGDDAKALSEAEELLRWLCDETYVLFCVERHGPGDAEVLGTGRIAQQVRDADLLATAGRGEGRLVRYHRSSEESPVHRAGKPGYFVVTCFGEDGSPDGCLVIDGLFTYKALHTPPEHIPIIRLALQDMLADRKASVASDRGKHITNAFNSLPLEYLLSEDRHSIWELTDRILRAEAEGGSDVHIRVGDNGRFAFVFVALPRWQFSEELRQTVQNLLLDDLCGTYADYGVYIDRYDNAVIHFYVTGVGPLRSIDTEGLRTKVLAHARSWQDRLEEAIEELGEGHRRADLFETYVDAFNEEHIRRCSVERIKRDIACLEALRSGAAHDCDLYISEFGDHPGSLNLRIFSREALNLSRELPVLSHFGFEVIDEYSRDINVAHLPVIDMDNFRFEVREERIGAIMARRSNIVQALRDVLSGRCGDDDLNRLVVVSDLTAPRRRGAAGLRRLPAPAGRALRAAAHPQHARRARRGRVRADRLARRALRPQGGHPRRGRGVRRGAVRRAARGHRLHRRPRAVGGGRGGPGDAAHQRLHRRPGPRPSRSRSSSRRGSSPTVRSRDPSVRSGSTIPSSRACICEAAAWRGAACGSPTAPRTSAPRSTG